MIDLIEAADNADKSKGERKWSRQCKIHQSQEIQELEDKEVRRMLR